MQVLKLAVVEVEDSKTVEEAVERIQRMIERFEERTLTDLYEHIKTM